MSEAAAIIGALVALLGALGAAGKFVWTKIEARFVRIETDLKHCHDREAVAQERRGVLMAVIEILWREVEAVVPDSSPALARAKKLLDDLKHFTIGGTAP